MHHSRLISTGALALLLLGAAAPVRGEDRVLRFADPSKPGAIVVQLGLGDVHVTGADVSEVRVSSDDDFSSDAEPPEDGLRRLNSPDNHTVSSSGNTISIVSGGMFGGRHHGESTDLHVTVPHGTNVTIHRSGPGDTALENIAGDVEIRAAIGDIELVGLSGGVVIESINGDVDATFTRLPDGRPVSISAIRGDVEMRVPQDAKARVRFRTLRGEVLTDFSADQLKTKMEGSDSVTEVEVDVTTGVAEAHAQATIEHEHARAEADRAREEMRRAKEEAKRAGKSTGTAAGVPPVPPVPPLPPIPAMPAFAGGEVVAGALNGGGTEVTITSLTGDITFRIAK